VADYIIVGAGSAGCVLAARLTEDPDVRVTLIEAGAPDTAMEIHIPAAFGKLFQSKWDWDYLTDPEPGLDLRRRYLPRGKMLGGSSSMNAMIYIRGNPADYDQWAAGGAAGWGWPEVLPYFLRAEDNERGASDLHGAGGPLTVSDGRSRHALMDAFLEAAQQAGHKPNDDFNGPEQDGVGYYQLTQRNGMRCSAAVAYLHPAIARPNLEVITDALCTRILFDGNRAIGVEYERANELAQVLADREVIISAGAYNSPQLLMLSGVGVAAELQAYGIEPRANLPVGENLQDHVHVAIGYLTDTESLLTAETAENIAPGRPGGTRLPDPRRPRHVRRRGPGAADRPRFRFRRRGTEAGQPGQGFPALAAAQRQAAHRAWLLHRPGRPADDDARASGPGRHRRAAGAGRAPPGGDARPRLRQRRRHLGVHQARVPDAVPPDQHLCHRFRGRPAAASPGPGGAARGGRICHAHGDQWEHQRADDHDRGKGSRHDPLRLSLHSFNPGSPGLFGGVVPGTISVDS
jgi:choline dehydrogenase-like flavoprotein